MNAVLNMKILPTLTLFFLLFIHIDADEKDKAMKNGAILQEPVFCDLIKSGNRRYAVLVLRGDATASPPTADGMDTPFDVWICPLKDDETLDVLKASRLGYLPQALSLSDLRIFGCMQGDKYVFVYETQWGTGRKLATMSLSIDAPQNNLGMSSQKTTTRVKIDGVERDVVLREGVGMPTLVSLQWDKAVGGGEIKNVRPLRLFIGKRGKVNLLCVELEGSKRLFVTKMTQNEWGKSHLFRDASKRAK